VAENLDENSLGLEEKLEEVTKAIVEERKVFGEMKVDDDLRKQISIIVFAERDRVLIHAYTVCLSFCSFKFSRFQRAICLKVLLITTRHGSRLTTST
jgi:hypothetical protein